MEDNISQIRNSESGFGYFLSPACPSNYKLHRDKTLFKETVTERTFPYWAIFKRYFF